MYVIFMHVCYIIVHMWHIIHTYISGLSLSMYDDIIHVWNIPKYVWFIFVHICFINRTFEGKLFEGKYFRENTLVFYFDMQLETSSKSVQKLL